jgi:hypothetical protein
MDSLYAVIAWVIGILQLQILHARYKCGHFSFTDVRKILYLSLLGSLIAPQLAEDALWFSSVAIFICCLCVGTVICCFIHYLCKATVLVTEIVLCN